MCQELREVLKYSNLTKNDDGINNNGSNNNGSNNNSNINTIIMKKIEDIQYRAHDMERGLFESKFNVGKSIIDMIYDYEFKLYCGKESAKESEKEIINNIKEIIIERWPNFRRI